MMHTHQQTTNQSKQILLLLILPFIGILLVILATRSRWSNINTLIFKSESLLILANFTLALGTVIKYHLMNKLWKYPKCIIILFASGSIMLILNLLLSMRLLAEFGIIVIILGQIYDACHWLKYLQTLQHNFKYHHYLSISYSFILPFAAFILFFISQFPVSKTIENISILCLAFGFITQSIHALYINQHIKYNVKPHVQKITSIPAKYSIFLLGMFSIFGTVSAFFATYVSGWLDGRHISQMHSQAISMLGHQTNIQFIQFEIPCNHYVWIFICGFVLTSCCIVCGTIIKYTLMNKLWKYPMCIVILFAFGSILIILMAIYDNVKHPDLHGVSAVLGIIFIISGQIYDTYHWIRYLNSRKEKLKYHHYILIVYSFVFIVLSIGMFIAWQLIPYPYHDQINRPKKLKKSSMERIAIALSVAHNCQWIGFWCLMFGFMSQTFHAIYINKHFKEIKQSHMVDVE
eukprot:36939_1